MEYVFKVFLTRITSLVISIVALSISVASLFACLVIIDTIENKRPDGVNYKGDFFSLFTYISSKDISFFLYPKKIINLQQELDDMTHIVATTGGRNFEEVRLGGKQFISKVSFVSDNFFDVLKIEIKNGGSQDFYSTQEMTCLVSSDFLHKNNLSTLPESITVNGKDYRVIGEVTKFKGLLLTEANHESVDIWIPWQHGHHILSRNITNKNRFISGLYWTIVTSENDNPKNLQKNIERLMQRTDQLHPPEDGYKSIKGLVKDVNTRNSAEESTRLYLYVSLIMFAIALINLSTWVALTRLSKINNEKTFLKLGINRFDFFKINLSLIMIPIITAFVLAIPIYHVYLAQLTRETAIQKIFAGIDSFNVLNLGKEISLMVLLTILVTYTLSSLIAKSANISYKIKSLLSFNKNTRYIFQGLFFISTILITISLIFSLFIVQYTTKTLTKFADADMKDVYFVMPVFKNMFGSKKEIDLLMNSIRNEIPNIDTIAVASVVPYSNTQTENYSLKQYGATDIKLLTNKVDTSAMSILGVDIVQGQGLSHGKSQLVVDYFTAEKLKKMTNSNSVIGLTLYDMAQDEYKVVGISSYLNYSADPVVDINVSYSAIDDLTPMKVILLKGSLDLVTVKTMMEKLKTEHSMKVLNINSLEKTKQNVRQPFYSRIVLCLIATVVSLIISILTILAIVNIHMAQQQRKLAIYSSLGLKHSQLWLKANKSMLITTLFGFGVGSALYWQINQVPFMQVVSLGSNWYFSIIGAFLLLFLVILTSMTIVFSKLFINKSIFDYLRDSN